MLRKGEGDEGEGEGVRKTFLLDCGRLQLEQVKLAFQLATVELIIGKHNHNRPLSSTTYLTCLFVRTRYKIMLLRVVTFVKLFKVKPISFSYRQLKYPKHLTIYVDEINSERERERESEGAREGEEI